MLPGPILLSLALAAVVSVPLQEGSGVLAGAGTPATLQPLGGFEENQGQAPDEVRFLWRGSFDLIHCSINSLLWTRQGVRVAFPSTNPAARVRGVNALAGTLNIIHGNNSSAWRFGLPRYEEIEYDELYPGIDVILRSNPAAQQVSWTATVRPGATLTDLRMQVLGMGVEPRDVTNGIWYVGGPFAVFIVGPPGAYQMNSGQRTNIRINFEVQADGTLTLTAGDYDSSLPLTIEGWIGPFPLPFGSEPNPQPAVDRVGNVVMSGSVAGSSASDSDVWIAKWSAAGELRWVTLVGGSGADDLMYPLRATDDVFAAGNTASRDFPVSAGAGQPAFAPPSSAFAIRLDGETGRVRAASFSGGPPGARSGPFAVDARGIVYLTAADAGAQPPGYAAAWDSNANRFLYRAPLDLTPRAAAVNSQGELYFAGADPAPASSPVVHFGVLRADGSGLRFRTDLRLPNAKDGDQAFPNSIGIDSAGRAWMAAVAYDLGATFGVHNPAALALIDVERGRVVSNLPLAEKGQDPRVMMDAEDRTWVTMLSAMGVTLSTTPDALRGGNCGFSGLLARFDRQMQPEYVSYLAREAQALVDASGAAYLFLSIPQPPPWWTRQLSRLEPGAPQPQLACAVSLGQRSDGAPLVPGQLVSVVGGGFGPSTPVSAQPDADGRYPEELAGVRVLFNGARAPLLRVSNGEAWAQVPYSLATLAASIQIELQAEGAGSATLAGRTTPASLLLFSVSGEGWGPAAAVNEDGTVNSAANPAPAGSLVSLFGTGGGALTTPADTGAVAQDAAPLAAPVAVALLPSPYGVPSEIPVEYAGTAAGLINGVNQINVRLPAGLAPGEYGVSVYAGPRGRAFVWPLPAVTIALGPAAE